MGAGNSYGSLVIQLESYNCYSGKEVTGAVHLSLKSSIPPSALFLSFSGKEKTQWQESTTQSTTNQDGTTSTQTVTIQRKGKSKICSFSFPLSDLRSGLGKGYYSFPFSFILPPQIPGSFSYSDGGVEARITYKLQGLLKTGSSVLVHNAINIWLKQSQIGFNSNIKLERTARLKTGCFNNSGICKLTVSYPQDSYSPTQVARFNVEIDNTGSKVDVTGVSYRLYWSLLMRDNERRNHYLNRTLIRNRVSQRIHAGEKLLEHSVIEISVNLQGLMKDLIQMCSTKALLIECLYSVGIEADIDASCVCCGQRPCIDSNIFVVPDEVLIPSAPDAPPDWNPKVFDKVSVACDSRYQV